MIAKAVAQPDWNFSIVVVVAVVIVIGMILAFRLLHKDETVKSTRYGFFVERDRYPEDDEEPWPRLEIAERTLPQWPDRERTVETPPKKEEEK